MKIEFNKQLPEKYKPVTVTLTFETEKELNGFTDLLTYVGPRTLTFLAGKHMRRHPMPDPRDIRELIMRPLVRQLHRLTKRPEPTTTTTKTRDL